MFDSFVSPWTIAQQVPLSMEFSRQENWSGLPCPPPPGGLVWALPKVDLGDNDLGAASLFRKCFRGTELMDQQE